MRTPLHILHLESGWLDAQTIQALLDESLATKVTRVQTLAAFVDALGRGNYDVVLADYDLASLDGISALKIVREKLPDLPFIFVARSPGEEAAIESIRLGATDFVLKNGLSRLVTSVIDAITRAEEREQRKLLESYLSRIDKTDAIRGFAEGVGHDLNNLLTAIIGKAQLAQEQLDAADPVLESIKQIEQTGRRAAELIGHLLNFSRRAGGIPQSVKQEVPQQVRESFTEAGGGTETILVAEDDLALLRLAGQVLDGLGYRVILAHDGMEAVSLFASSQKDIDLVALDISMPKMNGLEAYKRIRELDPKIPVILMSGDIEQAKCVEGTDAGLLQKPYNVDALGREVRKMLDQVRTKSSSGSK